MSGILKNPGTGVRPALVITLVILVILVAALGLFLVWALQPLGAPTAQTDTEGLAWVRSIYGLGDAPTEQMAEPTDVAVSPDGTIWGTDPQNRRVLGFTSQGLPAGVIQLGHDAEFGPFVQPEGVGVDERGHVFVADFGASRVYEFDPGGVPVRSWEVPNPLDVASLQGRTIVSTVYGVAVFDGQGQLTDKWGIRGDGPDEFDIAHGVAIAPDGTVYVADSQNSRVKALDPAGETIWVSPASAETTDEAPFQLPTGMSVDGAGRVVLVDAFEFAIVVLDAEDGSVIARHGEDGSRDGELFYPTGIAYDPVRDWFVVADTSNKRLQVFRVEGSGGGALEAARRTFDGPGLLWLLPLLFLVAGSTMLVLSRRRAAARLAGE